MRKVKHYFRCICGAPLVADGTTMTWCSTEEHWPGDSGVGWTTDGFLLIGKSAYDEEVKR